MVASFTTVTLSLSMQYLFIFFIKKNENITHSVKFVTMEK